MFEEQEYIMKTLATLRITGRRVPVLDVAAKREDVERLKIMRKLGWIGVSAKNGTKTVWITMKGRRVLKCFEKIYRDDLGG